MASTSGSGAAVGIGLGLTGLALVLFLSGEGPAAAREVRRELRRLRVTALDVLRKVSKHEGSYGSINHNLDGAGASYGIIQWTQISGNLGRLLATMRARDPIAFDKATDGRGLALVEATREPGIRPIDGLDLWGSTWSKRLVALAAVPAFREVQERMALDGEHWQIAEKAAQIMRLRTSRAMALYYDTAVQQGNAAVTIATQIREWADKQTPPPTDATLLASYAWMCSKRFRSETAPGTHPKAPRLVWRQVGNEWHTFAGSIDLYTDVKRRREGILADPELDDEPLA